MGRYTGTVADDPQEMNQYIRDQTNRDIEEMNRKADEAYVPSDQRPSSDDGWGPSDDD